MVGQMSANHLVDRVQRYVAKMQGTKQYWYQRYQELKALITQKVAPTFFFTFRQIYTDYSKSNGVPSVLIRAVIYNPHVTDSYFVSRLDEFCSYCLDHETDAGWKWLRFEWQAQGSIHVQSYPMTRSFAAL